MLSPDQTAATGDQSSKLNGAGVKTEDKTAGTARGKERKIILLPESLHCTALLLFGCLLFYSLFSNVEITEW